jgi:hypothetical protein
MLLEENNAILGGDNMINFDIFLIGVTIVSSFTGLVTEAVKKVLKELNIKYYSNTLAGVVAAILAIGLGTGYVILSGIGVNASTIACIIGLAVSGWLVAMVGYDKFMQAIGQFKTNGKD